MTLLWVVFCSDCDDDNDGKGRRRLMMAGGRGWGSVRSDYYNCSRTQALCQLPKFWPHIRHWFGPLLHNVSTMDVVSGAITWSCSITVRLAAQTTFGKIMRWTLKKYWMLQMNQLPLYKTFPLKFGEALQHKEIKWSQMAATLQCWEVAIATFWQMTANNMLEPDKTVHWSFCAVVTFRFRSVWWKRSRSSDDFEWIDPPPLNFLFAFQYWLTSFANFVSKLLL